MTENAPKDERVGIFGAREMDPTARLIEIASAIPVVPELPPGTAVSLR